MTFLLPAKRSPAKPCQMSGRGRGRAFCQFSRGESSRLRRCRRPSARDNGEGAPVPRGETTMSDRVGLPVSELDTPRLLLDLDLLDANLRHLQSACAAAKKGLRVHFK